MADLIKNEENKEVTSEEVKEEVVVSTETELKKEEKTTSKKKKTTKKETKTPEPEITLEPDEVVYAYEGSGDFTDPSEKTKSEVDRMLAEGNVPDETKEMFRSMLAPLIEYIDYRCKADEAFKNKVLSPHKSIERCYRFMEKKAREIAKNMGNINCYCMGAPQVLSLTEEYYGIDDRLELKKDLYKKKQREEAVEKTNAKIQEAKERAKAKATAKKEEPQQQVLNFDNAENKAAEKNDEVAAVQKADGSVDISKENVVPEQNVANSSSVQTVVETVQVTKSETEELKPQDEQKTPESIVTPEVEKVVTEPVITPEEKNISEQVAAPMAESETKTVAQPIVEPLKDSTVENINATPLQANCSAPFSFFNQPEPPKPINVTENPMDQMSLFDFI